MIDDSIDALFEEIDNSKEYLEYCLIVDILKKDKEVKKLISSIKKLGKEATLLEYQKDNTYKLIDREREEKESILKQNPNYIKYLSHLSSFNLLLKSSSSLIEDYLDEKLAIK